MLYAPPHPTAHRTPNERWATPPSSLHILHVATTGLKSVQKSLFRILEDFGKQREPCRTMSSLSGLF